MQYLISLVLWCRSSLVFCVLGTIYLFLALFFPPSRLHPFAKKACGLMLWAMGQKITWMGTWPVLTTPRIYIFNHTSLLDTLICIAHIPEYTASIGKKEQFSIPIWGYILKHWGCIPIDRQNTALAIEQLQTLQKEFSGDKALFVSPEGTRSNDGLLLPFKKGPFHIAEQCHATIIPIAIYGAFEALSRNSWILRPQHMYVTIGDPIPPSAMEEIRSQSHTAIQQLWEKTKSAALCAADKDI